MFIILSNDDIVTPLMVPKHMSRVMSTSSSLVHLASTIPISTMRKRISIKEESLVGHFTVC